MKIKIPPLVLLSCWAVASIAPRIACAQVYGGVSTEGTIVLSNFSSPETKVLLIASAVPERLESAPTGLPTTKKTPIPSAFKDMVENVARQYGLDPYLLNAMIKVESGYNALAVSPKGARGLMQLMPATARRFGVTDPFNPRENIRAGAEYLNWLLKLFHGDIELALAGYNAGEQAVIRAGYRIPAYAETRNYVPKVLAHYK